MPTATVTPYGLYWVSPTPSMFRTPWVDLYAGNVRGQRFPIWNHQRLVRESGFKCQLGAIQTNFQFANLLLQKCDSLY